MRYGKDYANLLALYTFYIYHAQLQKTNQPLATDEFTRKGLNWAIDRVKRIKKILKELKVIEVIQKERYSYIHLFYIYTKNKIAEIFGDSSQTETSKEEVVKPVEVKKEEKKPRVEREKSVFEKTLLANSIAPQKIKTIRNTILSIEGIEKIRFNTTVLAKWITYCERNSIKYNKNNLTHWLDKLNGRVSIEQADAIDVAIKKGWKNFYMLPSEKSEYHKLLGRSLMMDRDCDTLIDIEMQGDSFVYIFKNIRVTTAERPLSIFARCGYDRSDNKNTPMVENIRKKIEATVKKF
jgi:hypothetical protein